MEWLLLNVVFPIISVISGAASAFCLCKTYNLEFDGFGKVLDRFSILVLMLVLGAIGFLLYNLGAWLWIPCLIAVVAIAVMQLMGRVADAKTQKSNDVLDKNKGKKATEQAAGTAVWIKALWCLGAIPAVVGLLGAFRMADSIMRAHKGVLYIGAPLVILIMILGVVSFHYSSSFRFYSLQQDEMKTKSAIIRFITAVVIIIVVFWIFVGIASTYGKS